MFGAVLWEAGLATQMDQHTYYIVYTNTNSVWPQHTSVTLFDLSSSHCDCPSWLEGTTEVKIAANQNIWVENSNLFFVSARSRLDWGGSTRRIKQYEISNHQVQFYRVLFCLALIFLLPDHWLCSLAFAPNIGTIKSADWNSGIVRNIHVFSREHVVRHNKNK